ncbi:MAG: NUDIX domain-containing protein [Chlorobiaceae bacterium]|nr:NUDIX domain-containing protein [Chlorobiaceae bacterium]
MKHTGASIIFHNDEQQVLLMLRDDIASIPYPGMWDLPGGHVEPGETPAECIAREIMEEIEITLHGSALFRVYEFSDRTEHIFHEKRVLEIERITLHEGQMLRWFSKTEVENTELAYGFNQVLSDFFVTKSIG